MKIDPRSCERNIGIARSRVETPFPYFFTRLHKLHSQLRGSVFISFHKLFFCPIFTGSISTKTWKHCYFLKSLKLEMKHCYVEMESSTTIDRQSTSLLNDLLPLIHGDLFYSSPDVPSSTVIFRIPLVSTSA